MAEHGIEFESIQVRDSPPSIAELKLACDGLGLKKLLNTSGMDYRSMGLKDLLPTLTESAVLKLLNENGNLVKRPLVLADHGVINGFREADWAAFFDR